MGNGDMILLADKDSYSFKFASEIKKYLGAKRKADIPLRKLDVKRFRNRELGLHIPKNLRGKCVYFIHDSDKNPQEWWVELLLLKDLLLNSSAKEVTFVLPDMMYSRQDRKDAPHVPISSRALAESISSGLRRIVTMDLHAPQIQGFYPATVPVDNLYSFPVAVQYLNQYHKTSLENFVVVSPDVGGATRAKAFRTRLMKTNHDNDYGFALISKTRRTAGEIEEMILVGDVEGKNVLVVDDIIDSGGTLISAGNLLKERGVRKMMCYGTHGLFTEGTEKLKTVYDAVITSNSHRQTDKGIEVVDVRGLFAEAIYRAHKGESISKLFDE